jgi:hypothetical protein
MDHRQLLSIEKNARTTQKTLQDHSDKDTKGIDSNPAFAQTPSRRKQNNAHESNQHSGKSVTMLRKLLRTRCEVAEPGVEQHAVTIRGRPIGKRHPGFQSRHKRTHTDRKQGDDTGHRCQLTNQWMNCLMRN